MLMHSNSVTSFETFTIGPSISRARLFYTCCLPARETRNSISVISRRPQNVRLQTLRVFVMPQQCNITAWLFEILESLLIIVYYGKDFRFTFTRSQDNTCTTGGSFDNTVLRETPLAFSLGDVG